jgi:hypothetical protein
MRELTACLVVRLAGSYAVPTPNVNVPEVI